MTYISVTHTFNAGETCSAVSMNSNFASLANGLGDGSKEINVASANIQAATLASVCTTVNMLSNYSMTVGGDVQGDRIAIMFKGLQLSYQLVPTIWKNDVQLCSGISYASGYTDYVTGSLMTRGVYSFSAGDYLSVTYNSIVGDTSFQLPKENTSVDYGYRTIGFVGNVTMPRSGSVVEISFETAGRLATSTVATRTNTILEVVFDN